jgi:hypothetical protein
MVCDVLRDLPCASTVEAQRIEYILTEWVIGHTRVYWT